MFDELPAYILAFHFCHLVTFGYTLWTLFFTPTPTHAHITASSASIHDARHTGSGTAQPEVLRIRDKKDIQWAFVFAVISLGRLVFVVGWMTVVVIYYGGAVPAGIYFRLEFLLAALTLFMACHLAIHHTRLHHSSPDPHHHRTLPSSEWTVILTFAIVSILTYLTLKTSWMALPWIRDHSPALPVPTRQPAEHLPPTDNGASGGGGHHVGGGPGKWELLWDGLLKLPLQIIPVVVVMRYIYLDTKICQQIAKRRYDEEQRMMSNTSILEYGSITITRTPPSPFPDLNSRRLRGNPIAIKTAAPDPTEAVLSVSDVILLWVAAFCVLLPIPIQAMPWQSMDTFGKGLIVFSTITLITVVVRAYFKIIALIRLGDLDRA